MTRVSLRGMVAAGVPRDVANTLRSEATTLDEFYRRRRISRAAGLRHIARLAAQLAGERP